ncbi:hypothetical protein C8R48DRAFT_774564 [Suillus tomentosus]|nr:hypothetical protein C8R48DRAFT_774564 [Suillus tomentosus]
MDYNMLIIMKNQTHTKSCRVLLHRSVNAPYRQVLWHERDLIAVHHQSFPKPGEPHIYFTSGILKEESDVSPHRESCNEIIPTPTQILRDHALLYCQGSRRPRSRHSEASSMHSECPMPGNTQNFSPLTPNAPQAKPPQSFSLNDSLVHPQTLASPVSHPTGSDLSLMSQSPTSLMTSDNLAPFPQPSPESSVHIPLIHGARLFTPINVSVLSHPKLATSASNQAPCSSSVTPSSTAYSVRRIRHEIHDLNQYMHWFDSHGCELLPSPPPCQLLECGDLYIHQSLSTPNTRQMWVHTNALFICSPQLTVTPALVSLHVYHLELRAYSPSVAITLLAFIYALPPLVFDRLGLSSPAPVRLACLHLSLHDFMTSDPILSRAVVVT